MGSLTFVEIDELIPHEEIIPSLLDSVVSELRAAGMLIHPVVVSSQHHVVLDGNHRVEALRRIGARRVLAYQVDYYSDEVAVKRWFRVVSGNVEVEELLERVAGMLNVEVVRTGREESIESLESDVRVIASVLDQNGSAFLLRSGSPVPTYRAYEMMAEIDRALAPFELSYETEDIALARLECWRQEDVATIGPNQLPPLDADALRHHYGHLVSEDRPDEAAGYPGVPRRDLEDLHPFPQLALLLGPCDQDLDLLQAH